MIKVTNLSILIEGEVYKNASNTYIKCNKIPILWRKFFLNFANNRDYVNIYCNRPPNRFDKYCRDMYLHNFLRNNTEIDRNNNLDDWPEYAISIGGMMTLSE